MKILHTADWHLGNNFHGYDRTGEHRHFLDWLLGQLRSRQPDALVVAGDVFDSANPSSRAEQLLFDFLQQATEAVPGLQIVLIAGNHDSAARLEAPAALLKPLNIYVRGTVHFTEAGEPDFGYYLLPLAPRTEREAACVCMALPYLRGGDYPAGMTPEEGLRFFFHEMHRSLGESDFAGLPVVALAHFYAAGAEVCEGEHSERLVVGGQDCVRANVVGNGVAYTALGHLHKAQRVDGRDNVRYAGSALPMSFSERGYRHGADCVTLSPEGKVEVERLDYNPLRHLMAIPARGRAASVKDVFDEISGLPLRRKGDDGAEWPYLEIRIAEQQPEPTLWHDVCEALADRAVHLCRLLRVRPERDEASDTGTAPAASADELRRLEPLRMAQSYFEARYAQPMPQALIDRFKTAERETLTETD